MTATMILVLALIVLTAVCTLLIFRRKDKPNSESVRSVIMDGIKNVSELATIRRTFQSIVTFSDSKKIPGLNVNIPGTKRKFIIRYNGTIVCGCDLTKLKVSETYGSDRVKISLPRSEILDIYADFGSMQVYDEHSGLFSKLRLEDQNREITANLDEVKASEIQNGILELADGNVKKILESVVAPTGMLADIVFTDETPKLPGDSENPASIPAKLTDE